MQILKRAALFSAAAMAIGAAPVLSQTVSYTTAGAFTGTGCAGTSCTEGTFTLSFVGNVGPNAYLSGSQIGRPARWGNPGNAGHARLRTVRLARGATATAVLAITNAYNFPPKVCRRVTAAGLRVYPPNQFTSTLVPSPIGACTTRQIFMTAGVVQRQR